VHDNDNVPDESKRGKQRQGVKLEDNIGCNDNVPKQVEFGGTQKTLLCTAEIFGLGSCFSADKKAIDEVKTQKALGTGLMIIGIVGGAIGGVLAEKPSTHSETRV
jgi:hypothetical protein